MQNVFINGVQPSWASVKVNMLGRTVTGVKALNYSDDQDKENIYGAGNRPIARGEGNFNPEASIELLEFETRAILAALPVGDTLQDIPPFDIVVTFKPKNSPLLRTDIIKNAQFRTNGMSLEQGAAEMSNSHELIISHVEFNV